MKLFQQVPPNKTPQPAPQSAQPRPSSPPLRTDSDLQRKAILDQIEGLNASKHKGLLPTKEQKKKNAAIEREIKILQMRYQAIAHGDLRKTFPASKKPENSPEAGN